MDLTFTLETSSHIDTFIEDTPKNINISSNEISCQEAETVSTENITQPKEIDESNIKNNTEYEENTLIISEIKGKVFLPYTVDVLNSILEKNHSKYIDINDVIEKDFVIPYSNFKNPVLSRFKEAFKLVRNKEHKSIKEAFDLGMELLLNYNLHPAIISACRSLDELDIYLDYLEEGQVSKFDCFQIKFEIAPTLAKTKKML